MKRFKVIIIEDELPARDLIRHYLQKQPQVELLAECGDGFEGIKAIAELKPDLVFLDVQMPRITGFEMLELLDADNIPEIIFTTAYDNYAIKAFEYNAIDYLLKPFSPERFNQAVSRAIEKLSLGIKTIMPELAEPDDGKDEYVQRIIVRSGADIHMIAAEDILCIEAMDDYVLINTPDEEFLKKKTLKYYERKLDPQHFIRIHRSCIVCADAIKKIEAYSKDSWIATLKNGKKIPVSKAGYSNLKNTFDF